MSDKLDPFLTYSKKELFNKTENILSFIKKKNRPVLTGEIVVEINNTISNVHNFLIVLQQQNKIKLVSDNPERWDLHG